GLGLVMLGFVPRLALSATYPSASFDLVGVTFDDGGQASGGFNFNIDGPSMPLPQFYDIKVTTSGGSTLPGSGFTSSGVCYNNKKKFVCAPNDNFLIYVETGTPGEPGFDHLQLATFFAPNALVGQIGVLDPAASYEIGCTQAGCFTRHITAGAIRWGQLL
ncbi:MAG: hypothetical protein ACREE9_06935, partial [Stellaceae bacterium]